MIELATVLVSAGGSSEDMLRTCLNSLKKYKNETPFKIMVVCPSHQAQIATKVTWDMEIEMFTSVEREDDMSGSRIHASVLDKVIKEVKTPYVMTLDADCFPMNDGWLDWMMDEIAKGVSVTGILQPYIPPPENISKTSMEYRIRTQLCWDNTHVACQLVGMDTLKRLGVGYSDGDDTGLAIPVQARKAGMKVSGLKLTACAWPEGDDIDPEANRSYCLIFQDLMYHHGGGSRENQGHNFEDNFWGETRKRVVKEGAEFLLKGETYHYEFNNEEEVAGRMVDKMMQGMKLYLQTHDKLFKE